MSTNATQFVADTVRARFVALWTATAISWEAYNGKPLATVATSPWVKPSINTGGAAWVGIGGTQARGRTAGVVVVELFVPAASGVLVGLALADDLVDLFDRYQTGGLSFRQKGYARDAGPAAGGWHKWLVFCPWIFDALPDREGDVPISNSQLIYQAAHGLALFDAIGFPAGVWAKVAANGSSVRCDALVTQVLDSGRFVATFSGLLEAPAHGFTVGGLWLHQSTAGALTATEPATGVAQRVAVATDANHLAIGPLEQVAR